MPRTAFVSGHLDLTSDEFYEHYVPKLLEAIEENCNFVIGDARGTDSLVQNWLSLYTTAKHVHVYHMFDSPRYCHNAFLKNTMGGFQSDEERDAAMTAASDFDIAWVRVGREKSGTMKNILRRNERNNV